MGIEPTLVAWEATVLPLNYTRIRHSLLRDCSGIMTGSPAWNSVWQKLGLLGQLTLPDFPSPAGVRMADAGEFKVELNIPCTGR